MKNLAAITTLVCLWGLGCGVRRSTPLAYSGQEAGLTLPYLVDAANVRGLRTKYKEDRSVRVAYDEHTWVRFLYKEKRNRMTLTVIIDDDAVPASQHAAIFSAATELGLELWQTAAAAARNQEATLARAEADAEDREADVRIAEAEADAAEARARREEAGLARDLVGGPAGGATVATDDNLYCCVNKRYYSCTTPMAADECGGAFTRCMAGCFFGKPDCAEDCMRNSAPDPSACTPRPRFDNRCE